MPAVFVHGNPETAAVWSPLLAELEGAGADGPDLICLSPPGFGARLPTGFGATVGERTATLVERGMSEPVAEQVAKGQGEAMGQAALALYASAAQPVMAELGRNLEGAAKRPGLVLLATEDHVVGTLEQRRRAAHRAGARVETLDGLGHWWMTHDPGRGARVLSAFWASLDHE